MMLWAIATFVAFFIKGLCGFANTLVFTSILAFGVNNVNISPVELLLGYPSNIILTWSNRKKLKPLVFVPLSVLVIVGSIPGAIMLKNVDPHYIKIVFGVVIILLGIEMFLRDLNRLKFKESQLFLAIVGILSGALCGLFGVGALLAAYIGRVTDDSQEFKANISAVFIVENTFRIILYSVLGIITLESIDKAVQLMLIMMLGLLAGIFGSRNLNEKTVRRLVVILLIFSGFMMIAKELFYFPMVP